MSESVDTLLSTKHRIRAQDAPRLDGAAVRELADVARGRRDPQRQVRALGVLTAVQGEQAIQVLSDVALDEHQDPTVRAAAAAQLGRTSISATGPLLRLLRGEADPTLLVAAVGSLARIGTPEALETLQPLTTRAADVAAQATAASRLIAFRHRLAGYEPPTGDYANLEAPPRQDQATAVQAYRLREQEVAAALADLRTDGYVGTLGARAALGLRCQRDRLVVALDQTIATAGDRLAEHLSEGPLLAGVVGLQSPVDPGYAVRWVVLTWKQDERQQVALHRPAGPPALYGTARVERDTATFDLRSVSTPGVSPVEVRGTLHAGQLELEGTSGVARTEARHPAPLT
ncbi:MAG: HEAT repeat domain-containing protein [Dermatophilaceae bacterium]